MEKQPRAPLDNEFYFYIDILPDNIILNTALINSDISRSDIHRCSQKDNRLSTGQQIDGKIHLADSRAAV
jgi:hypothetical protein